MAWILAICEHLPVLQVYDRPQRRTARARSGEQPAFVSRELAWIDLRDRLRAHERDADPEGADAAKSARAVVRGRQVECARRLPAGAGATPLREPPAGRRPRHEAHEGVLDEERAARPRAGNSPRRARHRAVPRDGDEHHSPHRPGEGRLRARDRQRRKRSHRGNDEQKPADRHKWHDSAPPSGAGFDSSLAARAAGRTSAGLAVAPEVADARWPPRRKCTEPGRLRPASQLTSAEATATRDAINLGRSNSVRTPP